MDAGKRVSDRYARKVVDANDHVGVKTLANRRRQMSSRVLLSAAQQEKDLTHSATLLF